MTIYYKHKDFYIRPVGDNDMDLLMNHRNDFYTWKNLTAPVPITPAKQEAWFNSLSDKERQYFVLVKIEQLENHPIFTGTEIGMVRMDEIDFINRSCRVGIDIFKNHRGNRYSYNGWDLVLKYCFDELGVNRVWLLVLEINDVAIRVYNKLGFVKEGAMRQAIFRGGRFLDYVMMSILREEFHNDPIV